MMESMVANAIGNTFVLGALAVFSILFLTSRLFKASPLSHVTRYEVSKDGKKSNQFTTISQALHAAYPKVGQPA